jgi:hypothetical protein
LYERHPLFVKRETVSVGSRNEILPDGTIKIVECTTEYVPITKTIESLFKSPAFVKCFFENYDVPFSPAIYTRYQDGLRYRKILLPAIQNIASDPQNIFLFLQYFYDGMGMTNPLLAQASLHSYAMFYFLLLNLPPAYYASLKNIHLVATDNSIDLKKEEGFNVIFCHMLPHLKTLEEEGIVVDIPGIGLKRIFAFLAQFTGDNLGINEAFGFITCFTADYVCPLCMERKNSFKCFSVKFSFHYEH